MKLDAIVIIGGDGLQHERGAPAENFPRGGMSTQVIGVRNHRRRPQERHDRTSFGFDTPARPIPKSSAHRTRRETARKNTGTSSSSWALASHIGLECAPQTQPNVCLVSEEIEAKKMTLRQITEYIANIVAKRAENGENFGVALIRRDSSSSFPSEGADRRAQ
jgi:pyrophosphate--fructose-6-phosphate 1-phosphotransferase